MRFARRSVIIPAIAVLTIAAVACSSGSESNTGSTPTPGQPADQSMVKVPAPIDNVEILIAESFPPQYFLVVTSGIPNGCVQFDSYDVTRDGDTFRVTVTNLEPADKGTICTQVYGTVESNIPLGSDVEPGTTYTVLVNDTVETFKAQ